MPSTTTGSPFSGSLKGKRAIICGGTTGVGRATAKLLAANGCRVFICGRNKVHLEDALREIHEEGGDAGGISVDVGTIIGIERFFAAADVFLGGLDIAVLNAGVASKGELTDMSHEECHHVVAVNLLSCISGSLEAMRRMKGTGGHVVMTGSMSADVFDTRASVYVATKAGIRGFASSLRKEANPLGIKVSLIEPGTVSSDMVDETPEEQNRMVEEMRMLKAEDVAQAIVFMLMQPRWCDIIKLQLRPHLQLI
ncbi:MAG: short-chain dehydrogenase/reductase [Verrucomicrobiales bacterium]|nr:short-chain dehydrogenase/reductase [Verrucomicrobiales bacterium]